MQMWVLFSPLPLDGPCPRSAGTLQGASFDRLIDLLDHSYGCSVEEHLWGKSPLALLVQVVDWEL